MIFRSPQDSSPDSSQPTVISKIRTRQGVTGHNVRIVLAASLAASIVAMKAIWLFYFFGN